METTPGASPPVVDPYAAARLLAGRADVMALTISFLAVAASTSRPRVRQAFGEIDEVYQALRSAAQQPADPHEPYRLLDELHERYAGLAAAVASSVRSVHGMLQAKLSELERDEPRDARWYAAFIRWRDAVGHPRQAKAAGELLDRVGQLLSGAPGQLRFDRPLCPTEPDLRSTSLAIGARVDAGVPDTFATYHTLLVDAIRLMPLDFGAAWGEEVIKAVLEIGGETERELGPGLDLRWFHDRQRRKNHGQAGMVTLIAHDRLQALAWKTARILDAVMAVAARAADDRRTRKDWDLKVRPESASLVHELAGLTHLYQHCARALAQAPPELMWQPMKTIELADLVGKVEALDIPNELWERGPNKVGGPADVELYSDLLRDSVDNVHRLVHLLVDQEGKVVGANGNAVVLLDRARGRLAAADHDRAGPRRWVMDLHHAYVRLLSDVHNWPLRECVELISSLERAIHQQSTIGGTFLDQAYCDLRALPRIEQLCSALLTVLSKAPPAMGWKPPTGPPAGQLADRLRTCLAQLPCSAQVGDPALAVRTLFPVLPEVLQRADELLQRWHMPLWEGLDRAVTELRRVGETRDPTTLRRLRGAYIDLGSLLRARLSEFAMEQQQVVARKHEPAQSAQLSADIVAGVRAAVGLYDLIHVTLGRLQGLVSHDLGEIPVLVRSLVVSESPEAVRAGRCREAVAPRRWRPVLSHDDDSEAGDDAEPVPKRQRLELEDDDFDDEWLNRYAHQLLEPCTRAHDRLGSMNEAIAASYPSHGPDWLRDAPLETIGETQKYLAYGINGLARALQSHAHADNVLDGIRRLTHALPDLNHCILELLRLFHQYAMHEELSELGQQLRADLQQLMTVSSELNSQSPDDQAIAKAREWADYGWHLTQMKHEYFWTSDCIEGDELAELEKYCDFAEEQHSRLCAAMREGSDIRQKVLNSHNTWRQIVQLCILSLQQWEVTLERRDKAMQRNRRTGIDVSWWLHSEERLGQLVHRIRFVKVILDDSEHALSRAPQRLAPFCPPKPSASQLLAQCKALREECAQMVDRMTGLTVHPAEPGADREEPALKRARTGTG